MGLLSILVLLTVCLPAGIVHDIGRWRRVPLQQKNRIRAGAGAFAIALALGLWAHGLPGLASPWLPALVPPIGGYLVAGLGLVGVVYLVGGIAGTRGAATFDFFSVLWWGLGAAACVAVLLFSKEIMQWLMGWWS